MILCQCSELVQQDVAVHVQGLQTWKMMWRRRMTRTAGQAQVVHQLRAARQTAGSGKTVLRPSHTKFRKENLQETDACLLLASCCPCSKILYLNCRHPTTVLNYIQTETPTSKACCCCCWHCSDGHLPSQKRTREAKQWRQSKGASHHSETHTVCLDSESADSHIMKLCTEEGVHHGMIEGRAISIL